jgi:hypothetical protein
MTNSVDIRLGVAYRLDWGWGMTPPQLSLGKCISFNIKQGK